MCTEYTPELIERFYSKISKIPTEQGCLEWMDYHNAEGYGRFSVRTGRNRRAHRIAWEIVNGPIPAGLVIRHMCHNPLCCNVEHLRLGTYAENTQDMMRSGRFKNAPNTRAPYVRRTAAERFYAKISKTPNETGCLDWTACLTKQGYGHFRFGAKDVYAHRLAWELANGPIPDGLCVLHRCDRPSCCRVEHLFLGTMTDNMRDRDDKGRHVSVRGERNFYARITEQDVLAIRSDLYSGWRRIDIARHFGITVTQVGRILRREQWTHI